jgi:Zn-dependent protease with chaperone function
MTNGTFTDWNGNIFDIGPIYPFVGWEVLMVILLVAFLVWWHFTQIRMENDADAHAANTLGEGDNLAKALESEHTAERM